MERIRFYKSSFLLLLISAIFFLAFVNPLKVFAATFSITGVAYFDTNGNGVKDSTETAYPSGQVTLSSGQTTTTSSTGNYSFANLPSGNYSVKLFPPSSGYQSTTSNPAIATIGTTNTTVNFGIRVIPTSTPIPTPTPTLKPTGTPIPTNTPTPTLKPTATPTPIPSTGNYGSAQQYCPAGSTSGTFCGTSKCDNNGVNYKAFGITNGDCTYHSWNCSGSSCGTQYADHYWSTSCDKTNAQRASTGAGPTNPPRCVPPAPSTLICVLNTTSTGYNLSWAAITQATYNVYSGTTKLATVTLPSYSTTSTVNTSFTVKSVGGGRESLLGKTVICPPVPTATATPKPTATPTPTLMFTPTPTSTPTPKPTATATPTPVPNSTILSIVVGIDGIGSTGDNPNPSNSSGSNKNPLHPTRNVTVGVFDSSNHLVMSVNGNVVYNTTTGKFAGTVNLGTNFTSGNYLVTIISDAHLRRLLPGIQHIISATTNTLPQVNLVAGDINKDNALTILDYNILLSCSIYSQDNNTLCKSDSNFSTLSDLDDNGTVDQFDYNLFVREYSVQNGDQNPN